MKTFQVVLIACVGVLLASGKAVEEKRLIKTSEDTAEWMTEEQIFGLIKNKVTFIDVTDFNYGKKIAPEEVNVHGKWISHSPKLIYCRLGFLTGFLSFFCSGPNPAPIPDNR